MIHLRVWSRVCVIIFSVTLMNCEDPDEIPPAVVIATPIDFETVSENISISCLATDDREVTKLELWINQARTAATDEGEPWLLEWPVGAYLDGDRLSIRVRAYDEAGNTGDSDEITVTVDNAGARPTAVRILSVTDVHNGLEVIWEKSHEADFKQYVLQRSYTEDFIDPVDLFSGVNPDGTNFVDLAGSAEGIQYFRIMISDVYDLWTIGPVFRAVFVDSPSGVAIDSVTRLPDEGLSISWQPTDTDIFKSYILMTKHIESGLSDTLTILVDRSQTQYMMSDYSLQSHYEFWVEILDIFDRYTPGPHYEYTPASAFELLIEYMIQNDLDASSIISDWIILPENVVGNEADYFIMDIRSSEKYAEGHVPGAIQSNYAEVVTTVEAQNTTNLPVLITGYTGLSEAQALVALRLSGYPDAKIIKWGMSGWARQFDSWSGNVGNIANGHSNWVSSGAPTMPHYGDDPVLLTDLSDGAAILAERVDAVLHEFRGVNASDVIDIPTNYQILNYISESDYDYYGHIEGALQITPGSLGIVEDNLSCLDPSQTIVSYCWTGQTTSMLTAWLTVLGYDAKVLKFGLNALIYDNLETHKWTPLVSDYPLE